MSIRNNYRGHNYLRIGEKITQRVIKDDAFSTIAVSGQDDVLATPNQDLTFVDGTGITITTNASTDTITFAADVASETAQGIAELATDAEAVTGTATDKVTTPANLTARLAAPGDIGGTTAATDLSVDNVNINGNTVSSTTGDLNLKAVSGSEVTVQDDADATKELTVDLSGATASTKTTLVSSQTVDRSVTLPDATDTLVGKATTDSLTNKTIDGDNNTISNLAHGSEVDNPSVTTSGSNPHSIPLHKYDATTAPTANSDSANTDANGVFGVGSLWVDVTNDKSYVCVDATATAAVWNDLTTTGSFTASSTDTLTNKTFDANGTGNSISNIDTADISDNAITAPKTDLSIVSGDVIYGSGTDTWARLAKGSDGEVLTLASGLPSWGTAGGGWTSVVTGTASSSSTLKLDNWDNSTYYYHCVRFSEVYPATNAAILQFRLVDASNGTAVSSTHYQGVTYGMQHTDTSLQYATDSGQTQFDVFYEGARDLATYMAQGEIFFHNAGDGSDLCSWYGHCKFSNSSYEFGICNFAGALSIAKASGIDGIEFKMSSGNIATGEFEVFGLATG